MSFEMLTDITKCGIGTVAIARATTVGISVDETTSQAGSDTGLSAMSEDAVMRSIKTAVAAQDPLAVPLVLALTFPVSGVFGGRLVNAATYRDSTVLHNLLAGFGFEINDGQQGSCSFDLINRAVAGNDVDDEWTEASGTKQTLATRANFLRIINAGTSFTDDNDAELALLGITKISYKAVAEVKVGVSGGEQILADMVDLVSWTVTGSMSMKDTQVATAQAVARRLCAMRRGTFVGQIRLTTQEDDEAAPADKALMLPRLKFRKPRESKKSKDFTTWDVDFEGKLVAKDKTAMTIAQMVTMEDAA